MNIVSPVFWYVVFWICGAAVFLVAVRVFWINPVLSLLRRIYEKL